MLSLRSWNVTEWDINWSKNQSWRQKSFSRTDRSWVEQRITTKFVVFEFFRYGPERIRMLECFYLIPWAILHQIKTSRNVESQYWRLENSAAWKVANYFATYSTQTTQWNRVQFERFVYQFFQQEALFYLFSGLEYCSYAFLQINNSVSMPMAFIFKLCLE